MATVAVTFVVECSCTEHGEEVYVVGSHKRLGAWDPNEALRCTTSAERFPRWSSSPVNLPNGSRSEFKMVIRGPGGKKWEHGQNRLLEVSVGTTKEARMSVNCCWGQPGFNAPGKMATV